MPDYIILGQGICGSFLSYYLQKAGKKVLVIDRPTAYSASKAASGIINPVTGRRIVKTWLIDDVLPFAWQAYTQLGNELGKPLIQQCNVLDFFATPQMQEAFEKRISEEPQLLNMPEDADKWQSYFRYNYAVGEINPCYLADISSLLLLWRQQLQQNGWLLEEEFDWALCKIEKEKVTYKGIVAEKIICCDGVAGAQSHFFERLPFAFNKGEAIIAHITGLPQTNIYKQGINIVPWKEKDTFWIGSNYLWNYTDLQPTELFLEKIKAQLNYWLKLQYEITDHFAAERPANVERRPFVGLHPVHSSVGILNGMGTKGCSLAPYFAHQFTQHLLTDTPLEPLANVNRFSRILSR